MPGIQKCVWPRTNALRLELLDFGLDFFSKGLGHHTGVDFDALGRVGDNQSLGHGRGFVLLDVMDGDQDDGQTHTNFIVG